MLKGIKYFYLYTTLFNPLKHAIDMQLISNITGTIQSASSQVNIASFNCPAYNADVLKSRFNFFFIILIEFAYVFTLIVNLGNIIVEKETKMKV